MRRFAPAAAVVLALLIPLSACAPEAEPEQTPAPVEEAGPTPPQAIETLVVASGEKPPMLLDGDCSSLITPEELSTVLGVEVQSIELRDERSWPQFANVGGIACGWHGDAVSGSLEVAPRAALAGAVFPADAEDYYFVECEDWACGWRVTTDELWIDGVFSATGVTRESADAMGGQIAELLAPRAAGTGPAWERDTSEWWSLLDCEALVADINAELGSPLTGVGASGGLYHDAPLPGVLIGDAVSRTSNCIISDEAGAEVAVVLSVSGLAWTLDDAPAGQRTAQGVTMYPTDDTGFFGGTIMRYSDGVNWLSVEMATEPGVDEEGFFAAIADAAAGF